MSTMEEIRMQPAKLPKISIVTPSYNQGQFVEWTVRSVLLQRYPNLEYIVMDGGSTDATMQILDRYRGGIDHIESQRDNGQADAIHRGFARSTGDIMAYLNSDDMLAPGALHYVAKYFQEHPEVDVLYSHRCTVDENNRVAYYWLLPRHSNWYMSRWDLIPQETCFWRRSLFNRVGNIDPQLRFAMDYDLFVRFMRVGTMRRVNCFLGAFRKHHTSKTTQLLDTVGAEEIEKIWQRYELKKSRYDNLWSARFCNKVNRCGGKFAYQQRHLPGALPGIGYDYDKVWGGLLNDKRMPPMAVANRTSAA